MTFESIDRSIQGSRPVMLYLFTTTAGATYRYAGADVSVTFGGGNYTPTSITHGAPTVNSAGTAREVVVSLPASSTFVLENIMGRASLPSQMHVIVYRVQLDSIGDLSRIEWEGNIDSVAISNRMANLRVPSLKDTILEAPVPSVFFHQKCNNALYDSGCRISRAAFDLSTTIAGGSGVTFTVASIGGNPDRWFQSGEIVRDIDGERRMIIKQTGTSIQIFNPFPTLTIGDAVTLYAGCDLLIDTCLTKFDNQINFRGHPQIPGQFYELTTLVNRKR